MAPFTRPRLQGLLALTLWLTLGLPGALPAFGQTFSDVTTLLGSTSGNARTTYGAAAVDVNGDGLVDLSVPSKLYLQLQDGRFKEAFFETNIEDILGEVYGGIWGDMNNDGYPELYNINTETTSKLFINRRLNEFKVNALPVSLSGQDPGAAWADFDRDGLLDLAITTRGGDRSILYNKNNGVFQEQLIAKPFFLPNNIFCSVTTSDYDRDGDQDVYLSACDPRNTANSTNQLLDNLQGGTSFLFDFFGSSPVQSSAVTLASVWFDYDNDGWQDLYLLNTPSADGRTGHNQLFRNDGNDGFEEIPGAGQAAGTGTEVAWSVAAADFDNDGWTDLYVSNASGGHRLYHNNGDGTFTDVFIDAFASMSVGGEPFDPGNAAVTVADFNGDGWVDLYLANRTRQWLFYNDGGEAHWVKIKTIGGVSNRGAIGARIHITTPTDPQGQTKEITGGGGVTSTHHALGAHFGLGDETTITRLIIWWPNGLTEAYTGLTADEEITLVERGGINRPPVPMQLVSPDNGFELDDRAEELTLSWTPSFDPEVDSLSYAVYLRGPGYDGAFIGLTVPELTLNLESLAPGLAYTWMVEATDGPNVRATDRRSFKLGETVESRVTPPLLMPYVLPGVKRGAVALGDYDVDGDLDLVMTGTNDQGLPLTRLYTLQDSVFYIQVTALLEEKHIYKVYRETLSIFTQVDQGDVDWGDYDLDGDLDLFLTGRAIEQVDVATEADVLVAAVYNNTGVNFVEELNLTFPGIYHGEATWGDYDGDGDVDLLLTGAAGQEPPYAPISVIYRNDGSRSFVDINATLEPMAFSAAQWGDHDGDGDLDIALMGDMGHGRFATHIYTNRGGDVFEQTATLPGFAFGSLTWGDYDQDGDLDLVQTGGLMDPDLFRGITRIYRNEGGVFHDIQADVVGIVYGKATWGDYDGDTDLDLFIIGGTSPLGEGAAWIYRNEEGAFIPEFDLGGMAFSDVAVGDYNGDGDIDFVIMGIGSNGKALTAFFTNRRIPEVLPPTLFMGN